MVVWKSKKEVNAMRKASAERKTAETAIAVTLNLDGSGNYRVETGIGFFDHMLCQVARHGFFDLEIQADGDTGVDCHHTVEDTGVVLGQCLKKALGDKSGIRRYGSCLLPMEDALALCAVDVSGRPYLAFEAEFTTPRLGELDTEMVEEFFRAVCLHAGLNVHLRLLAGKNNHHMAEALFKAFGRALCEAVSCDPRVQGTLSTKGMLEG